MLRQDFASRRHGWACPAVLQTYFHCYSKPPTQYRANGVRSDPGRPHPDAPLLASSSTKTGYFPADEKSCVNPWQNHRIFVVNLSQIV
jgi:hypothetical protein